MNIEEVKRVVGRIRTTIFKNSNSYSIGMLKSHFRGSGLQFKEHQVYTHGDDVRFIDWKLLAKTSNPYVKTFEEERNVEIVVVIDASPTMFIGWDNISKLQASIEITCLLYLLAKETGDSVHALVLGNEVVDIPRCNGEKGIVNLITKLQEKDILTSEGKINLSYENDNEVSETEKTNIILKHLKKRKEIVLLSDFNNFLDINHLKRMVYQTHVHAFYVLSPLDEAKEIPWALYAKNKMKSRRGKHARVKMDGFEEVENIFGKRITRLRIDERYLEEFVKEML